VVATVKQELLLSSRYADRVPVPIASSFLRALMPAAKSAAVMTVEGRGKIPGRPPAWLSGFSDIRLTDVTPARDAMLFHFEAPTLEDAAPRVFRQADFWHQPPDPGATVLDVLGVTVSEIANNHGDSDLLDNDVLSGVRRFGRLFQGEDVSRLDFLSVNLGNGHPYLSEQVIARAHEMMRSTPAPQPVRLVGKLDMIRDSTRRFGLILDDGAEVPGVYEGDMADLQPLFKTRVLALGNLIYRSSGRPLRIDASAVNTAVGESTIWSRLPEAAGGSRTEKAFRVPQGPRSGIAALIGSWPGNESDEEVERAIAALS
jgi:hypothetical protein